MSNLSAAKQLAKKKNWSADDLAQIIGYVMMGETTAYIAERLFVCELDVREVVQETLSELSGRSFHYQAGRLGFRAKQNTFLPKHRKPAINPATASDWTELPQVWKKRRFGKVRNPQAFKVRDYTAHLLGDPPVQRSALATCLPPQLNYQKHYSTKLAKIKENTHAC